MSAPPDLLPDSRLRRIHDPKGSVTGTVLGHTLQWEQCYCASCGAKGVLCPTENMTFLFWLCDGCFEKYGTVAGTYAVPDEVFTAKLHDEQLDKYGRILEPAELQAALDDGTTSIASLAKDAPKKR